MKKGFWWKDSSFLSKKKNLEKNHKILSPNIKNLIWEVVGKLSCHYGVEGFQYTVGFEKNHHAMAELVTNVLHPNPSRILRRKKTKK